MAEPDPIERADELPEPSPEPAPQAGRDLEVLRELLVGEQLSELHTRLDQLSIEPKDVGRVLPQAIRLRTRQDEQLSDALAPTIEGAIETSVKRNPAALANAIFPIMGPAIRKSIRESLASIVEGFNKSLDQSLSPQGIRWRIEAARTGKPFSEVVLKHSLLFRVDEVFLIHRETSLLLEHVVRTDVVPGDPEMISSMLGAIQDFVSDSFSAEGEGDIAQVEFGERVLLVARSPSAVLACVVRGVAPARLRAELQETLEEVHANLARELREFDGDPAPFAAARISMEELLVEERAVGAEKRRKRNAALMRALVLAGLILVAHVTIGGWYFSSRGHARALAKGEAALRGAPGIVLTSAGREGELYLFRGLRDPLAQEPLEVLRDAGVDREQLDLRFEPYYSLEPELVLARVRALLAPPAGVSLRLEAGQLELSGSAQAAWCARARELAATLPGVSQVTSADLLELPDSPQNP